MTTAPPSVCELDGCEAELTRRTVTLVLETGGTHHFCSDRCERKWLIEQYTRQRIFLNRIYIATNGRASAIAKTALHTNEAP